MKAIGLGLLCAVACVATTSARAQSAADAGAVRSHVACYPFGIDMIGRVDYDAGVAAWKQCFAPDYQFTVFIGRGDPIVCPGDKCPLPKELSPPEMRAAFAKRAFDNSGFVKTTHHLTNVAIAFPAADRAAVNAYVQAWHWKADGTAVIGAGSWDVEVARAGTGWRIAKEKLAIVGAFVVPPAGR